MNNEENNNVVPTAVPEIPEINASPIATAPEATQPAPVEPAQVINEPVVVPSANDISPASPEVPTTPAQPARVDSNMIAANNVVNPNTMMTPVEPSDPNPQPEKKKKKGSPIILLLLLVVLAVGGYYAYNTFLAGNIKEEKSTKTEKTSEGKEEKEKETEEKISEETKNRIKTFVEVGNYFNTMGYNLANDFYQGKNTITRNEKLKMAYIKSVYIDKRLSVVKELPEKVKQASDVDLKEEPKSLLIEDYENAYKELFNEEIGTYEKTDIQGCPLVFYIDKEERIMYLVSRCGGSTDHTFSAETTKEEEKDGYYYVYQKAGYDGDLKQLIWKFDNKGNFVSTEQKELSE